MDERILRRKCLDTDGYVITYKKIINCTKMTQIKEYKLRKISKL
jgi:hypothetical protein